MAICLRCGDEVIKRGMGFGWWVRLDERDSQRVTFCDVDHAIHAVDEDDMDDEEQDD